MDYLDPRKRRAYHARLIIGYILIAIVIGLATVIIVYGANGYGINTKTGQIVQNGLLFVDSNPGGAEIYLNGTDRNTTTSARLILPAGSYTLTLKKAGYRDWTRQFNLSEQSVARYVYPFLFPVTPVTSTLKTYAGAPGLMTETPNQHWLLVENNAASSQVPVFDEYDTTTLDQTSPAQQTVSLPAGVLTGYSSASRLTAVEWTSDNNYLLLRHDYGGGSEYVVLNRTHPELSFNVDGLFGAKPTQVNFFNKKADQLYLFSQPDGSLSLGTVNTKAVTQVLKSVLAYHPYGTDLITYVTNSGEPAGEVAARIWNSGQTYKLSEFSAGTSYTIDAAQYSGHFYYIAGSNTSDRFDIYKDPMSDLKDPSIGKALPVVALNDPGAQEIGFSDNARFVAVENGQRFASYDFETGDIYQYPVSDALTGSLTWMDGHRLIGASGGKIFVMDFDGKNKQVLTATDLGSGGLFSADYHHLLTTAPAADGSANVSLQDVDMRAGVDLPKK